MEFDALDGAAAFPRSFRARATLEPNCLVQNWAVKKFRGGSGNYNNWCFGSLRALRLLRWTRSSFFCLTRTRQKGTRAALGTRGSEVVVASFSVLIGRSVSGVLGAPPDWLIAGERDQQFEVAGDSKIISWRFVERVRVAAPAAWRCRSRCAAPRRASGDAHETRPKRRFLLDRR